MGPVSEKKGLSDISRLLLPQMCQRRSCRKSTIRVALLGVGHVFSQSQLVWVLIEAIALDENFDPGGVLR